MVNQQFESDLKEAFSLHASCIPSEAAARLRGVDYRPRTSRLSPRMTVGALAGAAATTGAVVSVFVFGSAQAAFAGWSPSPTSVSLGQTSTADTACQAQLAAAPAGPGAPSPPGAPSHSGWSVVATDVRGPFTLVIYENGTAHASCLAGPSITVVSQSSGSGRSTMVSGTVRKGAGGSSTSTMIGSLSSASIEQLSVDHLASTTQGAFTVVTGQVEAGVTAVTLVRGDGEHVQTSVSNGALVAWWPGTQDVISAQITTAAGVTTQTLTAVPLPLPPARADCNLNPQSTSTSVVCTGGAVGRGSGGPSANFAG